MKMHFANEKFFGFDRIAAVLTLIQSTSVVGILQDLQYFALSFC